MIRYLGLAKSSSREEEGGTHSMNMFLLQFRLNKTIWRVLYGKQAQGYEFILIIYDNEEAIFGIDSVAGTYHIHEPMIYKLLEFASPNRAVVVGRQY
ncbi:MAG: hypothetical protein IPI42_07755 [Saprospiraceae bacterium]|nr:hypothetical protein [Candidatus Parvibacillus calidus]